MQTKINKFGAFGIPGTHGNTQPFVADPATAGANLELGTPVVVAHGAVGDIVGINDVVTNATSTTFDGVAVDPREHVLMKLPDSTNTLTVRNGDSVAVAKKGAWYVKVTGAFHQIKSGTATLETPVVEMAKPTDADSKKLGLSSGKFIFASAGTAATVLDYVIVEGEYNLTDSGEGGAHNWSITSDSSYAVALVRLG